MSSLMIQSFLAAKIGSFFITSKIFARKVTIVTARLAAPTERTQEMTVGFFANILPRLLANYIIYIYICTKI